MSILSVVGKLTRGLRAGEDRLVRHYPEFASAPLSIDLSSLAFGEGCPVPTKYTVSGEDVSPPLEQSSGGNARSGAHRRGLRHLVAHADGPSDRVAP